MVNHRRGNRYDQICPESYFVSRADLLPNVFRLERSLYQESLLGENRSREIGLAVPDAPPFVCGVLLGRHGVQPPYGAWMRARPKTPRFPVTNHKRLTCNVKTPQVVLARG